MYACICAAVTDDEVRTAVCRGARTVDEIGRATRAGTGCGTCHSHLCDMIASGTAERSESAAASL